MGEIVVGWSVVFCYAILIPGFLITIPISCEPRR